jgi:hypothetical protein
MTARWAKEADVDTESSSKDVKYDTDTQIAGLLGISRGSKNLPSD